jgi:hypothetical protein
MILGGLTGVATDRPGVEKDTVVYRSGTWVRTHNAWVF